MKGTWAAILFISATVGFIEQTRDIFISQTTQAKWHIDTIRLPLWIWIVGLLVVTIVAIADHSHKQLEEKENQIQNLTPSLPLIDIGIKEAFIVPSHGIADCFVRILAHNQSAAPSTIKDYRVAIQIEGKTFTEGEQAELEKWAAADMTWDDEHPEREVELRQYPLEDFLVKASASALTRGTQCDGWLRFKIRGVPKWPIYGEPLGTDIYYDNEGNECEEVIMHTELLSTNVKAITVLLQDVFNGWHEENRDRPFARPYRAIVPRKIK